MFGGKLRQVDLESDEGSLIRTVVTDVWGWKLVLLSPNTSKSRIDAHNINISHCAVQK